MWVCARVSAYDNARVCKMVISPVTQSRAPPPPCQSMANQIHWDCGDLPAAARPLAYTTNERTHLYNAQHTQHSITRLLIFVLTSTKSPLFIIRNSAQSTILQKLHTITQLCPVWASTWPPSCVSFCAGAKGQYIHTRAGSISVNLSTHVYRHRWLRKRFAL
jgi:hypothetical protein